MSDLYSRDNLTTGEAMPGLLYEVAASFLKDTIRMNLPQQGTTYYFTKLIQLIPPSTTIYLQNCPSTKPRIQPNHNEFKYYYKMKPTNIYLPNIINAIIQSRSQHKK